MYQKDEAAFSGWPERLGSSQRKVLGEEWDSLSEQASECVHICGDLWTPLVDLAQASISTPRVFADN